MAQTEKVQELSNNGSFDKFILKGIALVDFYADWCMPCLIMAPIMEELSEKFKGRIKFGKLNVDEGSNLAQKYQVSSIPNMILFKNGQVIRRFVGSQSADDFEDKLRKFV
ncbi:thioredoxin [Candidatus Pacearchaeota archaeon]|nr:hypothetical protein [uncultured archaeon]MBS3085616.1 thioredoxin [Candidatus Pacearchaeota archaeon]